MSRPRRLSGPLNVLVRLDVAENAPVALFPTEPDWEHVDACLTYTSKTGFGTEDYIAAIERTYPLDPSHTMVKNFIVEIEMKTGVHLVTRRTSTPEMHRRRKEKVLRVTRRPDTRGTQSSE